MQFLKIIFRKTKNAKMNLRTNSEPIMMWSGADATKAGHMYMYEYVYCCICSYRDRLGFYVNYFWCSVLSKFMSSLSC